MIDLFFTIIKGVPATLLVALGGFFIGAFIGLPLVIMRRSRFFVLRAVAVCYIAIIRGIPPVVWLFIIFFGVGSGILQFSPNQAALIGMGAISSGYLAEIYRGGYLSLPIGQVEASTALGMKRIDMLRYVVSPQVLRVSIPPMATFFVSLLKDGSVASTIGVRDIMMYSSQEAQSSGGGFEPFLMAAALYIFLSIPVAIFARHMDTVMRGRVSK